MPTGWRPADVEQKYSVHKIQDVYHFDKYETRASLALHIWSWVQLLALLLFASYLFAYISVIHTANPYHIYVYGFFIFIHVYAFTDLMDRNSTSWISEGFKSVLGFYFLWSQGSWFGSNSWITNTIVVYLLTSLTVTLYFVSRHSKEDRVSTKLA